MIVVTEHPWEEDLSRRTRAALGALIHGDKDMYSETVDELVRPMALTPLKFCRTTRGWLYS
ncbi:MAG: hypothetical protein QOH75_1732 [Actinomycetota bacterium]|jgi:hypothetical protein|nr:hypothetical protein [Actinomycetota bacterium]